MGLFNALLGTSSSMSQEEVQKKFGYMLIEGESIQHAYRSIRDFFVFTSKRLILVDQQGFTGRKAEYLCIPYRSISFYSIETAGTFELDSELKIWVRGMAQPICKEFRKNDDLQAVYKVLSQQVL
ncbi:PH domain-containing protein [Cesiribacter andamanensis]|uniref:Bacterial Pleckstrin homology domain-containing protein n=1 Tax=Cesiribacter andamanensis AMV16 TaxID=1279009 RepID=M7NG81_9BACT|nr:PH domain-containing protein [Cesiribacter andamanensis]EMR00815.1 hypothetical protein ADICEAN_04060 [Cesiribacter andamanensis AMV16]